MLGQLIFGQLIVQSRKNSIHFTDSLFGEDTKQTFINMD